MNEWTVVTTIVTLVGLILTILPPLLKLNTSITRIHAALTALEKDVDLLRRHNTQEHEQIRESNQAQDKQLSDLQLKVAVIKTEKP